MAAAMDTLTQEEWSLHALAGFLFFHFYPMEPPAYCRVLPTFRMGLCLSVSLPHVNPLRKRPHRYIEELALLI
jgi:hypothetical protein